MFSKHFTLIIHKLPDTIYWRLISWQISLHQTLLIRSLGDDKKKTSLYLILLPKYYYFTQYKQYVHITHLNHVILQKKNKQCKPWSNTYKNFSLSYPSILKNAIWICLSTNPYIIKIFNLCKPYLIRYWIYILYNVWQYTLSKSSKCFMSIFSAINSVNISLISPLSFFFS